MLLSVFSNASPFGNKLVAPIVEFDEDSKHYAYVLALDLKVGESGAVVRWFTKEHSAIIARAAVVAIEGELAKIAFEPFEGLEQEALPVPILYPQNNDTVVFRSLNHRAFLIAPSQSIYESIRIAYPDVTWLHPDLLAAHLMNLGHAAPVKGDFRKVCTQYAAGIVYLVGLNEGLALDCQTFALIKRDEITEQAPVEERVLPFFSRIGNENQTWFSRLINKSVTRDYYLYFDALIKGEISDKDATFFGRITKSFTN